MSKLVLNKPSQGVAQRQGLCRANVKAEDISYKEIILRLYELSR